eukprot:1956578-Alexandrium_andersonii.AAC.1
MCIRDSTGIDAVEQAIRTSMDIAQTLEDSIYRAANCLFDQRDLSRGASDSVGRLPRRRAGAAILGAGWAACDQADRAWR